MTTRPHLPVPRWKVFASMLLLAAVIAAIVAATEALRYPHPTSAAATAPEARLEPAADPRVVVECGAPLPREGQDRASGSRSTTPQTVTSSQLYDCPQLYDGSRIHYEGEVVGAVLRRKDGAWVHLNDDIYAQSAGPLPAHRDYRGGNGGIGVFISSATADSIAAVGGPTMRGDVLEIIGTFHRVDDASGEVAIIRASQATRTPGEPLLRPALPARRVVAIPMLALMAVVVVLERRAAKAA